MKLPLKPLFSGFILSWLLVSALFLSGCNLFSSSEERYRKAVEYQEKGELNAAIIEYKNVIKSDPEHAQARFMLGKAYLEANDAAGAKKELLRARSLGIADRDLVIPLAKSYLMTQEAGEAKKLLSGAQGLPQNGETLTLKGDVFLATGDIAEAKKQYESSLSVEPDFVGARYGLVRIALQQRDLGEATEQINEILKLKENDAQGLTYLAEIKMNQGDPQGAVAAYDRALSAVDNNYIRIGLARAYLAMEDAESADKHLSVLSEREPQNLVVSYLAAVSAFQKKDLSSAKSLLQEVLAKAPDHYPSLLLLGSVHYGLGEYEQVVNNLVRYLAENESSVQAKKLLAQTYVKLGDLDRAIEYMESAVDAAPSDPQLMMSLGNLYTSKGDYVTGKEYYEKAMKLAPGAKEIETRMALNRWASGEHDQAIADLNTITESDQSYLPADIALITAHMQSKEFSQALDAAKKLIDKKPDMPMAYAMAAAAAESLGQKEGAYEYLEQSIKVDPSYINGYLLLAKLELNDGDTQKARKRLETALKKQPMHERALLFLASMEEQAGNRDEAKKLVEQARSGNLKAITPRIMLANDALRRGQYDEARGYAEEALSIAPNNLAVLRLFAQIEIASGNDESAINTLEKALEINPGSTDLLMELARLKAKGGDLVGARKGFQSVLAEEEDHIGARWSLGGLALAEGDENLAQKHATVLIEQHPDSAAGYSLKGDILMYQKRFDKALTAYKESYERSEDRVTLTKLISSLRALGRQDESLQIMRQWLEKRPDDVVTRLSYATYLQSDGKEDAAVSEYALVLKQQPDNFVVMNNLAWLYHTQGKDDEAIVLAEKAYKAAPSVPGILDTYGWILVNNGQVQEGLKLLQEANAKQPEDLDIRYHLAAAHAQAGNTGVAKNELEEILASGKSFSAKQSASELLNSLR